MVPGVRAAYNLPDLAAAVAPRPVSIANPRSRVGRPLLRRNAAAAYPAANVETTLRREGESLLDTYTELR